MKDASFHLLIIPGIFREKLHNRSLAVIPVAQLQLACIVSINNAHQCGLETIIMAWEFIFIVFRNLILR
jgi:hypothetical protein